MSGCDSFFSVARVRPTASEGELRLMEVASG